MIMFDVLLDDIGKLGLSQILLILLYSYFNISGGMNALATVFIGYTPDYRWEYVYFSLSTWKMDVLDIFLSLRDSIKNP